MHSDQNALMALVTQASRIVAFTGAGISTECGIPDFRSPGGFWSTNKPIEFGDFMRSAELRKEAWRRRFALQDEIGEVKPGRGHRTIAHLVTLGKVTHVVTQNIDNLHQASGVPPERIIELHGNTTYALCLSCGERHELSPIREAFEATGEPPQCRACAGIVKTATVSFGQAMPETEMMRAEAATLDCDLFLAIGSSLVVYPAAGFPMLAKQNGAKLVIINRDPTDLDRYADLVLHHDIGSVMEPLARLNG
jgi:NAD-dependent deacetylase